MKPGHRKYHKSAIRITEESLYLLRSAPLDLLAPYYLGSVPFVLGLLYFWADMSRSAKAGEYSAMAALGLACLFVWMKFWQTFFACQVRAQILGERQHGWSWSRFASVVATQALIQSTRVIVMPIAALTVFPFGFCYAFYQNATVHVEDDGQTVKSTCRWAWRQARLWPRQNHLVIGLFWICGIVILLNLSFTAFIIPHLLKMLFGIDSILTLSGKRMLINTTFWITMLGMTYLLLDPFVKTVYILRCFYGSALKSGEDLKTELNRILIDAKKVAAWLLVAIFCATPVTALAAQRVPVTSMELDHSIEEVLGRREFSWRMPREVLQEENQVTKGPLEAAIEWVLNMLTKGIKILGKWISKFFDWLESLLPQADAKPASVNANWITPVRVVLISLLLFILMILTLVWLRVRQRRRAEPAEPVRPVAVPTPDPADEGIKADDFPSNRWLALARELTEKNDLRLAMRALYLATLAHLAEHELITIEIYKSNREYERELKRRSHDREELLSTFSKSLNKFERVWYGMYHIARAEFDHFAANQKRLLTFAEK